MEKLNILITFILLSFIFSQNDTSHWRDYPACKLGRLQSPIDIREYESIYTNDFSFVYQNYKNVSNCFININTDNSTYTLKTEDLKNGEGGYINFERKGVIKQYEFIRAELYQGLHPIDGILSEYELHLVHKKNLDFKTNKNQYRSIQDPNMFLRVVLRYNNTSNCKAGSSDNGLLEDLINSSFGGLGKYPVFQDKKAYFYEGSSIIIPCDENVNYYVVNDLFCANTLINDDQFSISNVTLSNKFGRPLYKNFMNYREVMNSKYIFVKMMCPLILLFLYF